jgi:hypothetical protein
MGLTLFMALMDIRGIQVQFISKHCANTDRARFTDEVMLQSPKLRWTLAFHRRKASRSVLDDYVRVELIPAFEINDV